MKGVITIGRQDKIIFTLFSLWLLVDTFNGYLLRNEIPLPLSQIYKFIVALIVATRIANVGKMSKYYVITVLYLCIYSVNVLLNNEDYGASVVTIGKLLTSLLLYCYSVIVVKSNPLFFKISFWKVFRINFIVFSVNILMGLWGIGFNSYTENGGFGYCGFFFAPNELSGVVAAIFPWAFYFFKKNYGRLTYLVASGVLFAIAFMLSSKSGILATLLAFIMISFFYGNKLEKRCIVVFAGVLVVASVIYINIILNSELPIMQRFTWFLEQDGAVDALTSGRLGYWEEEGRDILNAGPIAFLLGLGGNRTVEMDPYDALLNLGVIGFVWLMVVYCKGVTLPLRGKVKSMEYSKVIFTSNTLLILISIIAGHVLFSSMAGLFIAMSNAWLKMKNEKNTNCLQSFSV